MRVTTARRARGGTGCFAPPPARPSQLQIMYGLAGERRLTEYDVPWLPGYEGSQPVRVGNAAHGQLSARRIRRGHGRAASGAPRRPPVPAMKTGRSRSRCSSTWGDLGSAGPRPVGSPVGPAPFHLFKGDGVGGIRSRHSRDGDLRIRGPDRSLARRAAGHPPGSVHARIRRRARKLRAVVWLERTRRQPAAAAERRISFRPTTRACAGRWRPSNGACSSTGSCAATIRRRVTTACRDTRGCFSRAVSGWWMPTCS